MITKYYDADCNFSVLDGKTVSIIGFGSQGHAHAMNLKESGANVVVGLRPGSSHEEKAKNAGLTVMDIEDAAEAGDIVMMLTPDELQAKIYREQIAPHLHEGNALAFAHGFNIHFQQIVPATGAGLELDAIGSAIIGGTSMNGGAGSITGTLIGVFIMSLLKTGLPFVGLQANWQQIITGIILILAVSMDVIKRYRDSRK